MAKPSKKAAKAKPAAKKVVKAAKPAKPVAKKAPARGGKPMLEVAE